MEKKIIDCQYFQKQCPFPDITHCTEEGILAMGGDLSLERLISAYASGIFPWFSPGDPILWWNPDPRFILIPEEIKVSKSMRPYFNQKKFKVSFDKCFAEVIDHCGNVYRPGQDETWITDEMKSAYIALHEIGLAHSVEVWRNDKLVGGLYGVSLGTVFFGESMFSLEPNASKYGFISLVQYLKSKDFKIIDCQVYTDHLSSLGARFIDRNKFLDEIEASLKNPTMVGKWEYGE